MSNKKNGQTFVFFGIVGSGKGTQAKLLQEFLAGRGDECAYIGTGEIFRKILESSEGNDSLTHKAVKDIVTSGRLIPDDKTNELVLEAIELQLFPAKHSIFDGYPRTIPQSMFFENEMKSRGRGNIKIINIELGQKEAMKRNMLRGRSDDTPEGLAKRFDEYAKNVISAMNYFKDKEDYKVYTINGEQSVKDVHKDIVKALGF